MPGKKLIVASPHGFCGGVARAIATAEEALRRYAPPVYCFHEIVHNRLVVEALEQKGMIFTDRLADIPRGAVTLFSAHGVSPAVRAEAERAGLQIIDATCPFVTKVHREVKRFAKEQMTVLLIGYKGHEEIEGVAGEAPESVIIVESEEDARTVQVENPEKVAALAQTTLSVMDAERIVAMLRERFPALVTRAKSDICYATQNRQQAVRAIAPQAELFIVLGSPNSSNSRRLVEVSEDTGCRAVLVGRLEALQALALESVAVLALTAAASTPEPFVEEVVAALTTYGFDRVESPAGVAEDVHFPLPDVLSR